MNLLIAHIAPNLFTTSMTLVLMLPVWIISVAIVLSPLFIWKWTKKGALNTEQSLETSKEILEQLKILNRNVELLVNLHLPPKPGDYPPLTPTPACTIDEEK